MAIRFDAAADRLLRTSDLLDYNAAYTWMAWVYISADQNAYAHLWGLNRNTAANDYDYLGFDGTGTRLDLLVDIGGAFTEQLGSNLATGTWYHLALVRNSASSLQLYLNGASDITNTRSVTGRAAASRMEMGGFGTGNVDPFGGRVTAVKIWSAALTAAEIDAESRTIRPQRTANLYAFTPALESGGLDDWGGAGRGWTAGGTLTTEDGPPVAWGGPILISQTGAGGAVTGTGSPALAAMTGAGVGAYTAGPTSGSGAPSLTAMTGGGAGALGVPVATGAGARPRRSIRFYGTATGGIDRVRIPLVTTAGAAVTPANLGSGAFTYECWIRCAYADNTTAATDVRYSNIVLDRDIWNDNRGHCPLGVTRSGGVLVAITGFNVSGSWTSGRGTTNIGDGNWHHVAIDRNGTALRLLVDGAVDATITISSGSYAYPTSYTPSGGADNQYLVIGAEKHDFDPGVSGYAGDLDELRLSSIRRYTGTTYTVPTAPFITDGDTAALYHADSASGTLFVDSSVSGIHGEPRVGGVDNGPTWLDAGAFAAEGAALPAPLTGSGVGAFTVPTYTGAGSPSLPSPLTSAGGATHTPPAFTATGAPGLPAPLTSAGAGTHTAPVFTGSGAPGLAAVEGGGTGTYTAPTYTGAASPSLPSLTGAGAGAHTAPTYTGTGAPSLPAIISSGAGSFVDPGAITGTGAPSLPGLTGAGAGTFAPGSRDGSGAPVLSALVAAGDGTFTMPVFTGAGAVTLIAITGAGAGTFLDTGAGVGNPSLPALTASGAGTFTSSATPPPRIRALTLPARARALRLPEIPT